ASGYRHYIIDSFFALCAVNHSQYRNIEYYAGKLNISSRYLYKITKELVQSTPKQIIDYYVSGSAKKWLLTTILTNQQIADKLNFPDQATFGQFFKRNVGMSPSEFRNKYR
ncbi:MAG: helix-turn-helix domain-containing protein, partial [Bacteroidales bacterium]